MSTDDHFARIASLDSALAQAQADLLGADGRIQMAVQLYEDEKASHTRTLAELALLKEALAASEAERERWNDIAQQRKRHSIEAEQALFELHHHVTGRDTVPGDYRRCADAIRQHYDHEHMMRESAEWAAMNVISEILERDEDELGEDLEMTADYAVARLRKERCKPENIGSPFESAFTGDELEAIEAERARVAPFARLGEAIFAALMRIRGEFTETDPDVVLDELETAIDHGCAALEFVKKHGDEIAHRMRFDVRADEIADELESLMLTIDLNAHFDDDEPTEPMAAKEPT